MGAPAIPLKEFDIEMASTRKLLERVPGDKGAWKPHQKSFSLGHLAQLVAWIPAGSARCCASPASISPKPAATSLESPDALVSMFDKNVRERFVGFVGSCSS